MKYLLILSITLVNLHTICAGTLVIEGKYQNENLYVQNGPTENGVGFCTYEVTINDEVTTDEVNSSSFEIDFTQFRITPGEHVVVKIKHKDDCSPRVINPEVLKPHATFEVLDINIDKSEILNWTTKNEMGSLPYSVEEYRWHRWIKIGEVQGLGKMDKNSYSFKIVPHSGENKIRVRQIGYGDVSKKSNSITFISNVTEPTYALSKDTKSIVFSSDTMYEIYDVYGKIVKTGYSKNINLSNLSRGTYYLCYDNVITDFKKKR